MYTIQQATPGDAVNIFELDKQFQNEIIEFFRIKMPDFIDLKKRSVDKENDIRGIGEEITAITKRYFLLKFDKKVIGYISGEIQDRGKDKEISKIGYIDGIFILKKHRGKGWGKNLLNALFDWFKNEGLKYAILGVSEPNSSAIDFYRIMNFKTISREMVIKL